MLEGKTYLSDEMSFSHQIREKLSNGIYHQKSFPHPPINQTNALLLQGLTSQQISCLHEIEERVMKEERYSKTISDGEKAKIIDREQLLRQLRSREFIIEDTLELWRRWVDWRVEYDIENITVEQIENELRSGKAFWHQCDLEGNPCCVVLLRNHITAQTTHRNTIRFLIYLMDLGIKIADRQGGTKRMSVIWDREGLTSKNFDISFISLIKQLISMFQDNYSERLAKIYILHPSFIMKQAYGLFKQILSEKVKSKILILNELNELKQFFSPECILRVHGGTSDFNYTFPYPTNIVSNNLESNAKSPAKNNKLKSSVASNAEYEFSGGNIDEISVFQELHGKSFHSLENNSTNFFNLNAENHGNFQQERTVYESSNPDLNFEDGMTIPQQQVGYYKAPQYQEDEVGYQNGTDRIKQKVFVGTAAAHQQTQEQSSFSKPVQSGCCGCKSDDSSNSSCFVF